MKYSITKPRMISGKRADYHGVRISLESAYEEQAMHQLYPKLGKAPKGRKTERETEAWLDQIRKTVEHRAHLLAMGMPVQDTASIDKRIEEYLAWGRVQGGKRGLPWGEGHERHQADHLRYWVSTLGLRTLSDVRQGPFDQAVARLARQFAPNTVNHYANALTGICTWAVRSGYMPASPLRFRQLDKTPKTPRGPFTLDELRILFQGVPWARGLVYRAAYYLRFRRNECASLRVSSVLWTEGLMKLDYKSAKDRRNALKPIPASLLKDLWEASQGKPADAPLFDWSKRHAALVLHRDMERLGIPLMRDGKRRDFHSLGHSTATSMDRHQVGPALASKFMRHKTWAQTQEYVNHEVEEERVVSQGLENEIEHTDDTKDGHMPTKSNGVRSYGDLEASLSPSATSPTHKKHTAKIARFRRFERDKRKAPAVTWETAQKILAQCAHTLREPADAQDLRDFLALSPAKRAEALKAIKRAMA
jgi:integrase